MSSDDEHETQDTISDFNFMEFYATNFDTGEYIYSPESGIWYYYDNQNILHESVSKTPIMLKIDICKNLDRYFRANPVENQHKVLRLVGSSAFAESTMSFLRGYFKNDNLEKLIDSKTNLIAFNNGILYDIESNEFRKIEKSDFISKTMNINYTENISSEKTTEIKNIVYSLFENDILTTYFLKTLALSLFTTKFEKLNILTGNGRNGKSLIMNYLSHILKNYATTAESDFLTSKMRNGISCSLINAKNTRLLLLSEPNSEDNSEMKLNNALIKSITGNDEITARALYRNSETFKPTFNVFLLCNEIPNMEKVEFSMIERLNIIKFNLTFVDKKFLNKNPNNRLINIELKRKLTDDLELKQAFIKLLFDIAYENINKPFKIPKQITDVKTEYLEEIDIVKQFIDEYLIKTDNEKDKIKSPNLFNYFKSKTDSKICSREFYKSLERYNIVKSKIEGIYFFKKLKIKSDFSEDTET